MKSRAALGSALVVAVGLLLSLSPESADAASPPRFSSLPTAHVPEMLHPRDAPTSVPETERLAGVNVQRNSFGGGHASLIASATEGRCVTIGAAPPGLAPSGNAQAVIRVSSGSMPLRVERLTTDAKGQTELEIVDAWLDVTTAAVKEVSTTHISLSAMGRGPAGYLIYGFRQDETLQVVLPAKERLAYVDTNGTLGFTSCGHVRLVLNTQAKTGSMILAASHVTMPGTPRPVQAVRAAGMAGFADSTIVPQAVAMPQQRAPDVQSLFRGLLLSVSASRSSRDKEPLISVTASLADEPMGLEPMFNSAEPAMPVIDTMERE